MDFFINLIFCSYFEECMKIIKLEELNKMNIKKEEYKKFVDRKLPPSDLFKNSLKAFFVGGGICTIGEGISSLYKFWGMDKEIAGSATSITLIFLGILFTGLGLYSKLARHAGAGTIVPITGFANSVASPAIEAKTEGFILGVAAKIFTIAGPVIVYGTVASVIAGLGFYFFK